MSDEPSVLPSVPEGVGEDEAVTARVRGEPLTLTPKDLYIPPDALEVFLETFEGPLDLLLYLIRRQNLDVLDIPIAEITRQYMKYIELMRELRLELAAEYLVMAAVLAEIKSRMLLPRAAEVEDEEDPRAALVRRLQEYERFKQAAANLDDLARLERDVFMAAIEPPPMHHEKPLPDVGLDELLQAFREVLGRADMFSHHQVQREPLSVRERMSRVLASLGERGHVEFVSLFTVEEGRRGVVVTFLAILELIKGHLVEWVQAEVYAPIYLRPAGPRQGWDDHVDMEPTNP
ncbi:segregation and condensation protein A [Ectothiorhodospira marina]|uniref:Segregation and condensation protein A n=1 Tax=Ectothiorhodospira marina TaxID=1396821 RepID=A0A1H7G382_9GAMM|nr:segregation/condensation protein A [Ectothiorhodospira marina]SEK31252.1 condensin subunit ScpA [Ectothiorhodospira marina]